MKEPLFNKLEQICFVVEDLYKAMDLFIGYGIGPFKIMRFGDAGDGNTNTVSIENVKLHGRDTGTYSIIVGLCMLPESGVELEIIQPLTGESIFAEYLREHGPGIQHLSISHVPFDEAIERIEATGHEISQVATVDKIETCVFSDHRDVIGSYLELHKRPDDFKMPDIEDEYYPEGGVMPEGVTPMFIEFNQLGIVVGDMDEAIHRLNDDYGIGPWIIMDFGDTGRGDNYASLDNCRHNGEKTEDYSLHGALCNLLNVQLEMLQTVKPGSGHELHFKKHGPDIHHVSLTQTQSYEECVERMAKAGNDDCWTCNIDVTETCNMCYHETLGIFFETHKRPDPFVPPEIKIETYPEGLDLKLEVK